MRDLFSTPLRQVKVRNGIYACSYANGTINIDGIKYLYYSMTEAIKKYRQQHPAKAN